MDMSMMSALLAGSIVYYPSPPESGLVSKPGASYCEWALGVSPALYKYGGGT